MHAVIDSLDAQYPDAAAFERLLDARYSCRAFLDTPVDDDIIRRMFGIAQRTASWCNTQPWQVIVTRGAATHRFRAALAEWMKSHEARLDFEEPVYEGVSLARRRECGFGLYDALGIAKGDREASRAQAMKNFDLFGAPHTALITTDAPLGVYGAVDCGAYVANVMTAATGLGLGTIAQAALAQHAEFIRAHFNLPKDRLVVCGITFGYADVDHPANKFRTTRAAQPEVLRIEGQ
jgi:nitroreductase